MHVQGGGETKSGRNSVAQTMIPKSYHPPLPPFSQVPQAPRLPRQDTSGHLRLPARPGRHDFWKTRPPSRGSWCWTRPVQTEAHLGVPSSGSTAPRTCCSGKEREESRVGNRKVRGVEVASFDMLRVHRCFGRELRQALPPYRCPPDLNSSPLPRSQNLSNCLRPSPPPSDPPPTLTPSPPPKPTTIDIIDAAADPTAPSCSPCLAAFALPASAPSPLSHHTRPDLQGTQPRLPGWKVFHRSPALPRGQPPSVSDGGGEGGRGEGRGEREEGRDHVRVMGRRASGCGQDFADHTHSQTC